MLTVEAPAKINLTLEVLAKRQDGYHEISSIIQAIDLCDVLSFDEGSSIEIVCDNPDWQAEKSLIPRTVELLLESSACSKGVKISLLKRIPLLSGLAGDSSAAAATLKGLNIFWGLGYTPGQLADFAAKLGSDVSFFLSGGTALVQGRGEIVSPLPSLPEMWVVLLMPDLERTIGKTGKMYSSLEQSFFSTGEKTDNLVSKLTRNGEIDNSALFNVFEHVAYNIYDGLDKCRNDFLSAGAAGVHLAGSGPTLFTMVKNKNDALEICERLKEKGYNACAVKTLGHSDLLSTGTAA
ncbi:MAG: 4-(cytidine 5'-diphospho)-2-C-methyl-D-erythritol kinase [Dehalococcoidales bacterium]|nr:4-(cytidine 5'-diphospho)-2-C-methyl-D-erythritol kinase [Dehalococcoidales bacterium]